LAGKYLGDKDARTKLVANNNDTGVYSGRTTYSFWLVVFANNSSSYMVGVVVEELFYAYGAMALVYILCKAISS